MQIVNFAEQNSVMNHFMAELRDKKYQQNRLLFRNNIRRIGRLMAYELSKTLDYQPKTVTSPLGQTTIPLTKQSDIVLATVLRAGLPFHEGFLDMFDNADNGFVSAFRMYINREHTEVGIHTEYIATQSSKNKTLIIVDPMLATGGSLAAAIESLVQAGRPKKIHICCIIAAPEGIEVVKDVQVKIYPNPATSSATIAVGGVGGQVNVAIIAVDGRTVQTFTKDCPADCEHPRVLLIQRGNEPFKGYWAFPGGFMNMDETTEQCAARELEEETGMVVSELQQIGAYSKVNRDPRGRTVTVAYLVMIDVPVEVRGQDDAAQAKWFPISELPPLAFDHDDIMRDAMALFQTVVSQKNS